MRGPDGVSIRVLLLSLDAIGPFLLHVVNTCLSSCDFPDSWNHSLVHPIFKSGDPDLVSNYRPISIVPTIAKVVERVVQRQLAAYMSDNHLLSPSQHGFRPHHSTETALLSVTNRIFSNMARSHVSLLCLLDLSKCFDVIPHSLLLSKLQLYGIDPAWFSSYLTGHTQSVCISSSSGDKMVSQPLPNAMGVFQGSALGPLLFTIFANQILISDVKRNLPSLILRMESTLTSLASWFHAHGLKLNTSKTEILLLGTRQNTRDISPVSVRVGGETIQERGLVKNLGVLFDRHLTWDAHVSNVVRECVGLLVGLRHLSHFLPQRAMLTIVQGLVISRVRYCLSVYGNGSAANDARLMKIVNFATRVNFASESSTMCLKCGLTWAFIHLAKCVTHKRRLLRTECVSWASLRISLRCCVLSPMCGNVSAPPDRIRACAHPPPERRPDKGLSRTVRRPC